MKAQKRRKNQQTQNKKNQQQLKPGLCLKYKFNISMDNLRPFMVSPEHSKTFKKLPQYKQMLKEDQDNSEKLPEERLKFISNSQNLRKKRNSPDLTREVSNQILSKIETNGIRFQWAEVQQTKSQHNGDQMDWPLSQVWSTFSQKEYKSQKNQSFASTMDPYSINYYATMMNYQNFNYQYQQRARYYDPNVFIVDINNIEKDQRTTIMIKNIPNKYTIQHLSEEIDDQHSNSYDFLYLPCDIKNNCNVGYGFINFINTDVLKFFFKKFHNKKWLKFRSQKICNLTYARLQGLSSLIDHFQNSKVLNHKEKRFQPIIRQNSKIDHLIRQQQGKPINP